MTRLAAPHHFVVYEDDDLSVEASWHFGPQGHPASMRVILITGPDDDGTWGVPQLWVIGPGEARPFDAGPVVSSYLEAVLEFGQTVDKVWGKDWAWHCCTRGKPCSGPCRGCHEVTERTKSETRVWLHANPPPRRPDHVESGLGTDNGPDTTGGCGRDCGCAGRGPCFASWCEYRL